MDMDTEKIFVGIIFIAVLSGCGSNGESTETTQDGKNNPDTEIANNWNQGNWNEIDWQ